MGQGCEAGDIRHAGPARIPQVGDLVQVDAQLRHAVTPSEMEIFAFFQKEAPFLLSSERHDEHVPERGP
jgi:hypothetical protein